MINRLLIMTTMVILSGCVNHEPYPSTWPPLVEKPGARCEAIIGTYLDRGEVHGSTAKPSLTNDLFGYHSGWQKATRVSIVESDDASFRVEVRSDSAVLLAKTLTKKGGEYSCDGGRAVLQIRRSGESFPGGIGLFYRATVELTVLNDYLVKKAKESGVVLVLLIPVPGSTTTWVRFPRVHE